MKKSLHDKAKLVTAIFATVVFTGISQLLFSQSMGISVVPITPDPSSILEISSNSLGLLIPRMSTTDRGNITSPATGLLIYNTTTNAFNYYNGGWIVLPTGSGTVSGTNTGDQTITLTGDVMGSGTGSFVTAIGTNKVVTSNILNSNVTYAKVQNTTASRLLGNPTGSAAAPSEIKLGTGLVFQSDSLDLNISPIYVPSAFSANTAQHTTNGNLTVPAGVYNITIEAIGAGGGGGAGGYDGDNSGTSGRGSGGGGGGGAGEYTSIALAVTPGDNIAWTVGTAGNNGTGANPGNPGTDGGTTIVTKNGLTVLRASGGAGGGAGGNSSSGSNGSAGSLGAGGNTYSGTYNWETNGASGTAGSAGSTSVAGTGGSAGSGPTGTGGNSNTGGAGGNGRRASGTGNGSSASGTVTGGRVIISYY